MVLSKKKEVLVLACDGQAVIRAANRMLKPHGLKILQRGTYKQLGDQRYISLEEGLDAPPKPKPPKPTDPYMDECEECGGTGESTKGCVTCGETLTNEDVDKNPEAEACIACVKREEDYQAGQVKTKKRAAR